MSPKSALDVVSQLARRKPSELKSGVLPSALSAAKNSHETKLNGWKFADVNTVDLRYSPLEVPDQPPVPQLANKLDRVLFNPGVNFLKDPRTNVYNFDSRLEQIMSITDFDFSLIAPYVPAGRDSKLSQLASENGRKFTGSTSSLTPVLTQFHHALSHNRPPQILNLPKYFPGNLSSFSAVQRAPTNLWLKNNPETETYAVTVAGNSQELILTLLGQAMETMLTTECGEFAKWSKRHPENGKHALNDDSMPASTYNYTLSGSFLMRSQLDCYDPRLPGTGMFDLKTRACCAIRHDIDYAQINDGSDYHILKNYGQFESFSREFYELIRSAMFKYSLQARIGRMDGIFIAYHSIRRLFGFEYLPLSEIDKIYHTAQLVPQDSIAKLPKTRKEMVDLDSRFTSVSSLIADNEFKLSIELLGKLFEALHERIPGSSSKDLNVVVHCNGPGKLLVFARSGDCTDPDEPKLMGRDSAQVVPPDLHGFQVTFSQSINNKFIPTTRYPSLNFPSDQWRVSANMEPLTAADLEARFKETQSQYVYQELTSEPRTDELPDENELKTMLSKLPEATELQSVLRKYGEMGASYAEWDSQRPKIEL